VIQPGHRKVVITIGVILLTFLSLWVGKMGESVAAELVGAALLFYSGANVAGKFSPTNGSRKPPVEGDPP